MSPIADPLPTGIQACGCLTPFGGAEGTVEALLDGRRALRLRPVLGPDGGDCVPLALIASTDMAETLPPRWLPALRTLRPAIPADAWGSPRCPVVVTSSNFGVGSLYAYLPAMTAGHLRHGAPFACVEMIQDEFGWGGQVHVFSHACVSAHLGLMHAARLLQAGLADRVLVFTFDFVSPFVAGGFHSLKILNSGLPAPYEARETRVDRTRRRRRLRGSDQRGGALPHRGTGPAQRNAPLHRQSSRRIGLRRLRRCDRRRRGGPQGLGKGPRHRHARRPGGSRPKPTPGRCPAPRLYRGRGAWDTPSEAAAWSS